MNAGLKEVLKDAVSALCAGFLLSCAAGESRPGTYQEFRSIEESLKGHDSSENRNAMHALFEEGRAIIPGLVEALDSEASASVLCGTNSLYFELFTVDFDSPPELGEGHGGTVGEIALYLIESIVRSDIYFARDCSLEIDGEEISDSALVQGRIQAVASALRKMNRSELENLTLGDLETIMSEQGLGFPKGDS